MPKYTECEIWLIVDEDANHVAAETEEAATERYCLEVTKEAGSKAIHRIRTVIKVPLPEIIEAIGDLNIVIAEASADASAA